MAIATPNKPGVYFTRAKLLFIFKERLEYARIFGVNGVWSKKFESTAEAKEYGERNGWIVRGGLIEKRQVIEWRSVTGGGADPQGGGGGGPGPVK